MIKTIDRSYIPTLMNSIDPSLSVQDMIWAHRDIRIRRRLEQKKKWDGMLPFLSYYRSGPIRPSDTGQSHDLAKGQNVLLGESNVIIKAIRVAYSYAMTYHHYDPGQIVEFEKKLLFELYRSHIKKVTVLNMDIDTTFTLTSPDISESYYTEEVYDKGKILSYSFEIEVETAILKSVTGTVPIDEILFNIYGYGKDISDPVLYYEKVIEEE